MAGVVACNTSRVAEREKLKRNRVRGWRERVREVRGRLDPSNPSVLRVTVPAFSPATVQLKRMLHRRGKSSKMRTPPPPPLLLPPPCLLPFPARPTSTDEVDMVTASPRSAGEEGTREDRSHCGSGTSTFFRSCGASQSGDVDLEWMRGMWWMWWSRWQKTTCALLWKYWACGPT